MGNNQTSQSASLEPDRITYFTEGEGSSNTESHEKNGNLDTSSGEWLSQPAEAQIRAIGNKTYSSSNTTANNINDDPSQAEAAPLAALQTYEQSQPSHPSSHYDIRSNATEAVAAPIEKTPIVEKKFGEAGVKEVRKIIHLMTEEPNNGEKLADGYDVARDTNILHLSKYGAQSVWTEGKVA